MTSSLSRRIRTEVLSQVETIKGQWEVLRHQKQGNGVVQGYCLFSLRLIGSAMFGATFNLVTRVGLP